MGSVLALGASCGAKVSTDGADAGVLASTVTPMPACADPAAAAPKEPLCGGEVSTCDPYHPQGLPLGACTSGATCDVTVRNACACADEPGPRFPYRCACAEGSWECELMPPDGRICENACLKDAGPADAEPGDGGFTCPKPKAITPPGPRVTAREMPGTGACVGKTLGAVIDAVHAANPTLNDITRVYDPDKLTSDGSFVYAFGPDDGFALALKRGGGDCPAGCTENEYWYFRTDSACTPKQVGHYKPLYGSSCLNVEGAPMWATPPPPDPLYLCASDKTPQDISGAYTICVTGQRNVCSEKGGAEPIVPLNGNLSLKIEQGADRSTGKVTVTGTGHPKIDGIPFDATFSRRRFKVAATYSNLPAKCPDQWQLSIELDFEGAVTPGKLQFFETHAIGCSESTGGGTYCKGAINVDLFAP